MEDKQVKKIKYYLQDVVDGRDDLLQSTEKLITNASLQVQALLNTNASLSQRDQLIKYLVKALVLFAEMNHSVSKFCENELLPNIFENSQTCMQNKEQRFPVQDLHSFFKGNMKESIAMFDYSMSRPKLSNNQLINDESNVMSPLDNTTLKAICLANTEQSVTYPNIRGECDLESSVPAVDKIVKTDVSLPNNIPANNVVHPLGITNTSLIQECHEANDTHISPAFSIKSESDVFSTVSSLAYQHPLVKFKAPIEIPKQYNTQDMEKIKENLIYLSKKMGFDSDNLNQMQNQFSKNHESKKPVMEVQQVGNSRIDAINTGQEDDNRQRETDGTNNNRCISPVGSNRDNEELQGDVEVLMLNNQSDDAGPAQNTGAIRKQKIHRDDLGDDLSEFSASSTDSKGCEKVSIWLNNNRESGKTSLDSTQANIKQNSAIEKLHSVKRYDRNEEVREKARNDMPDLKLVPVELPKVIKNDLSSNVSCTEAKNDGNKIKIKDFNKEYGVYVINKMEPPDPGAVCIFSHIESPSEFYLQIIDEVSPTQLDEIAEKLDTSFRKTESVFKSKKDAVEQLGQFCFGYIFGDKNAWFRLQVLDWEMNYPSDVKVKSIDYGFRDRTSYKYLRRMTKDLADIPMLAIQCHFPLLYPPGSTYSNRLTEWPQETIDILCDMVNLRYDNDISEIKMFQLTLAMMEEDSLGVDMIECVLPGADSVRNMLLDIGSAVDIVEDYGNNPELAEFFEDVDELERAENLNELVLGYDATDEARICRFTRSDGTCYKGKNCKLEHVMLKDGYTTDKTTAFYTAINEPIFPIKGETVQVLVTAFIDSCTYLVHVIRKPIAKENGITMDKDMCDLMDALNHKQKISKYENLKVYPALGEIILAYYSLSKSWMRVAVRDLKYDNIGSLTALEVYAVDFGDQFVVKLRDTRAMMEDFMHLPFQAIQIYLHNYQHRTGCDAKKAKRFFEKHVYYKNFFVHISNACDMYRLLKKFKAAPAPNANESG